MTSSNNLQITSMYLYIRSIVYSQFNVIYLYIYMNICSLYYSNIFIILLYTNYVLIIINIYIYIL